MNTATQKTILAYLVGNVYGEQKQFTVSEYITPRALVRMVKQAFKLQSFRHKYQQFTGVDAGEYIRLDIIGASIYVIIDINGGEYDV
jgi:hypothetical protein